MTPVPLRGEVWLINLDPVRGHEQAGIRIPYHIEVRPPEGGLRTKSYVMCDDIRSVSRERLSKRLGSLSPRILLLAEDSLRVLGL